MKRSADKRYYFDASKDVIENPYIGFMSFNHFRGGKLYSDTTPAEGWKKERYPVPSYVEENGFSQGWHPDTGLAYIRILWRDFEPEEGVFNFAFVEEILSEARKHKQYLMFRIMPHTTRADEDVPDWLKAKIPCPERPDDKRVKDSPSDPLYFSAFAKAVRALGSRFDNDPVLYSVDISLYGAWGEGHGFETVASENLKLVIDAYTETFRKTFLFGQICAPELVAYARKSGKVGWRADGFGDPYHMLCYLPKNINAGMSDYWKDAPVSCEAFWYMNEWERQGWDVGELVDAAIKWHISSFNNKSSAIPEKWRTQVTRMLCSLGYRFSLRTFECPETAAPGDELSLFMFIENRGNAPIYNKIPLYLRVSSAEKEYSFKTDIDITKWLPGDNFEYFTVKLPENIPAGEYVYSVKIGSAYPEEPVVRFASVIPEKNGGFVLGTLNVSEG